MPWKRKRTIASANARFSGIVNQGDERFSAAPPWDWPAQDCNLSASIRVLPPSSELERNMPSKTISGEASLAGQAKAAAVGQRRLSRPAGITLRKSRYAVPIRDRPNASPSMLMKDSRRPLSCLPHVRAGSGGDETTFAAARNRPETIAAYGLKVSQTTGFGHVGNHQHPLSRILPGTRR